MKLKYKIAAVAALLMATIQLDCDAQETDRRAIKYRKIVGIKGGVNFSSLFTNRNSEHGKMLSGFNLGLFAKLPLTRYIAIQPELYFTSKGGKITYSSAFANGTARFRLNYLELPLLLVVNVNDNFNIHAGPYAAFLIDGRIKNSSNAQLFNFEQNIDEENLNRMDAGVALGAAIDIGSMSLGVRYSYSLRTVGKEGTFLGTTATFPDARNGVLNLYLAVSLN